MGSFHNFICLYRKHDCVKFLEIDTLEQYRSLHSRKAVNLNLFRFRSVKCSRKTEKLLLFSNPESLFAKNYLAILVSMHSFIHVAITVIFVKLLKLFSSRSYPANLDQKHRAVRLLNHQLTTYLKAISV